MQKHTYGTSKLTMLFIKTEPIPLYLNTQKKTSFSLNCSCIKSIPETVLQITCRF